MPHLDQPEEKEGKKEEGEQTHTNASPPTSKMKILQGNLGNGEGIQFEDNISSNKDDGGLVALGITRKQMCDALLALQNDETYRKILRKEIGHAVKIK